ncbi:MAG: three-Cys-motif partner protein TcmP [Chlorobiaceae bacterium]|nr:three-Cys-motif partner protein TcmP [Chlorobiaceae bacterium]
MSLDGLNGCPDTPGASDGASGEKRLDAFAGYIEEYLALSETAPDWKTIYFDGFAGSGSRRDEKKQLYGELNFTPEEECGYKGAAERVMNLEKGFDYYYFVDDHQSLRKLKEKLGDMPESGRKRMIFRPEECNGELARLADAMHSDEFSTLLLLDPLGFAVDWRSIARFAGTRTDLWIVIPAGTVVNKLLDDRGNLDGLFRLEPFFGLKKEEIMAVLATAEKSPNLFEEETLAEKIALSLRQIAALYVSCMKKHWKYVTDVPLVYYSGRKVPICTFLCATDNRIVHDIAPGIIPGH